MVQEPPALTLFIEITGRAGYCCGIYCRPFTGECVQKPGGEDVGYKADACQRKAVNNDQQKADSFHTENCRPHEQSHGARAGGLLERC